MRILAIYRHYVPDTAPYARILHSVLNHCNSLGHEATVFTAQSPACSQPHADTLSELIVEGVHVHRVRLLRERKGQAIRRSVNFAWFLLRAILFAVRNRSKFDLIVGNTYPPVFMGWTLRLIRRITGIPFIYHVQDIHPESALMAGKVKNGRIYSWLRRTDTRTCARAERLIILSDDMKNSLLNRGVEGSKIRVINNPPHQASVDKICQSSGLIKRTEKNTVFLFAGNLGDFQGLELLVDAMHCVNEDSEIHLVFMGEGSAKKRLRNRAGSLLNHSIYFLPQQPVEIARAAMREADFTIVSLQPEIFRYAYPSKAITYLSVGSPVLAVVEQESELSQLIKSNQWGYVAADRTPESIANQLTVAALNAHEWSSDRRQQITTTSERKYGLKTMQAKWTDLLREIETGIASDIKRSSDRRAA